MTKKKESPKIKKITHQNKRKNDILSPRCMPRGLDDPPYQPPPPPHPGHDDHLCQLIKKLSIYEIKPLVKNPKYICRDCKRTAAKKENLCNPEDLNKKDIVRIGTSNGRCSGIPPSKGWCLPRPSRTPRDYHKHLENHLCSLVEKEITQEEYMKLVKDAKYVCIICGRTAAKEENLCKPELIN